jgi:hypothetical protein
MAEPSAAFMAATFIVLALRRLRRRGVLERPRARLVAPQVRRADGAAGVRGAMRGLTRQAGNSSTARKLGGVAIGNGRFGKRGDRAD